MTLELLVGALRMRLNSEEGLLTSLLVIFNLKKSKMSFENNEKFDLKVVQDNFSSALHEDDDVHLKHYLKSYDELNKFFNLMGTVFGFVSKDLKSKMDILAEFLDNEKTSDNFRTVKKMIEYERDNQLLHKKGYTSGSRTLLRLHRGLDFIRLFLKNVGELKDDDSTGTVCRSAYDSTLAKYHPFVIRKGAQIAMYTLPTREVLLRKVCGEEDEVRRALETLPKTLDATAAVYERIEALYSEYNLHALP